MGLTTASTGLGAVDHGLFIKKQNESDLVIALAGNPNVGKSTVFNALTGLNQHTGNWPGKTVANAQGYTTYHDQSFVLVDIPGSYSLMAHSPEEEVARDFICFGQPDGVVVVCDATCLERNMNLVLQTMEITGNVIVCVNLIDEAKRKGICPDFDAISADLGVPVIPTAARAGLGLSELQEAMCALPSRDTKPYRICYVHEIEEALAMLTPVLADCDTKGLPARWLALRLLDADESLLSSLRDFLGVDLVTLPAVAAARERASAHLTAQNIDLETLRDKITASLVLTAEGICADAIRHEKARRCISDRHIDRILTSKWSGFPLMLAMLALVFWITIAGANVPSRWLSSGFFWLQEHLRTFMQTCGAPLWLTGALVDGVYRTLTWVVAVMLPPMAIFFPLFTLLEDLGYLPRVAFNLDKYFQKCHACGKQALTMCMGFGCNAAGIVGCRIIDSPRERLIAMLTNAFVPCNGRFAPPQCG